MSQNAGVRSLERARLFGSTTRVLDLPRLIERFHSQPGATTAARPFEQPQLNRAIVIKHALRPHERAAFDKDRAIATKLVFPITLSDLGQGGLSIFIDESRFQEKLLKFLGLAVPNEALSRDERLLRIFDAVPSFDPFLIAERAQLDEVDLPLGLIDLSDNDLVELRQTIAKSLSHIAALAISDGVNTASDRLASAFLNNRDDKQLAPLRDALKMGSGDFRKAIFAWKGILFYQWKLEHTNEAFMPIVQSLRALKPLDGDHETTRIVRGQSRKVVTALNHAMIAVSEQLMGYEDVIRRLSEDQDVDALRTFLENADGIFQKIGDNASILSHCIDYWEFGLRGVSPKAINAERAIDIVNGLAGPLSLDWSQNEALDLSPTA